MWAVVTKFYDSGESGGAIFCLPEEAENLAIYSKESSACDTYVDYFNSLAEAEEFISELEEA